MDVLNSLLYQRLQRHFRSVRVANQGSRCVVDYHPDWVHKRGRLSAQVVWWGETYRVSCPFCSDTRQRLNINHHWAVKDKRTRDDMLHLVTCFNEGCLSTRIKQQELHSLLFPEGDYGGLTPEIFKAVTPVCDQPPPMTLPAGLPVETLEADHPAWRYLVERGFEPAELSQGYGLFYCDACYTSRPKLYDARIIIPIFGIAPVLISPTSQAVLHTPLLGWQARAITASSESGPPKYLSAAGMQRNRLLYGLLQALNTTGAIVLVEGPVDAWRVGKNALALIGKSISPAQIELLQRHFRARPIIVWLDADAPGVAAAVDVCARIRHARAAAGDTAPVVVAQCPAGRKDPGECTSDEVRRVTSKTMRGVK